jgi:hypothetical protein
MQRGWHSCSRRMHPNPLAARRMIARGFVGESNTLAGEYHSSDFDMAEHAAEVAHLVQQVGSPARKCRVARRPAAPPTPPLHPSPVQLHFTPAWQPALPPLTNNTPVMTWPAGGGAARRIAALPPAASRQQQPRSPRAPRSAAPPSCAAHGGARSSCRCRQRGPRQRLGQILSGARLGSVLQGATLPAA